MSHGQAPAATLTDEDLGIAEVKVVSRCSSTQSVPDSAQDTAGMNEILGNQMGIAFTLLA
jgi:hypothetical protein